MLSLVPPPGCGEGSILVHPSPAGRLQVAAILASPLSVLLVLLAFRGAGPVMILVVISQLRLMLTRVGGTSSEFSCVPAAGRTGILRIICWLNWEGIDKFMAAEHRSSLCIRGMGIGVS